MAKRIIGTTPKRDGYRMPAEFEPQQGVWMLWPERNDNWRDGGKPAQKAFADVAKAIARFEKVTVGASVRQYQNARAKLPENIRVVELESDDAWVRDCGPTFLVNDKGGLRAVDWEFNAWGGLVDGLYFPWDKDDQIARKICEIADVDSYRTEGFVLEGGSIHVDGEGTVLTTEMCLLSEGRNPDKSKEEIEQMRAGIDAEKQAMSDELNAARQAVEAEKAAMKAELEAEKEKLSALKNKYHQQINAMEEEFNEIKTNILRTAGKLDSLKSKLPEEDSVNWDIIDHAGAVDFPAEEIQVDHTIDPVPVSVEPVAEIPAAVEIPEAPVAADTVTELPAEDPAGTYDIPADGGATSVTLEELTAPDAYAPQEAAPAPQAAEEISFDDIDIDLPDLNTLESAPEQEAQAEDEISFEGLEDLFKDEK